MLVVLRLSATLHFLYAFCMFQVFYTKYTIFIIRDQSLFKENYAVIITSFV